MQNTLPETDTSGSQEWKILQDNGNTEAWITSGYF